MKTPHTVIDQPRAEPISKATADNMAADFKRLRNGTATPIEYALMDMEPKEIGGKWYVVSEDTGAKINPHALNSESECWAWIDGVKTL